jgi:DNA-binding transcriptional MerR regulator
METQVTHQNSRELPVIPNKQYFTISEVGRLCDAKNHVLRYWEQEFPCLQPIKRRGNRRYYQHKDILLIRKIRDLLYFQGFTIGGARVKLQEELDGCSLEPTELKVEQETVSNLEQHSLPFDDKDRLTFNVRDHIQSLEAVLDLLS